MAGPGKNWGVLKNTIVHHHVEINKPNGRFIFLVSHEKNKLVMNSNNFFTYFKVRLGFLQRVGVWGGGRKKRQNY